MRSINESAARFSLMFHTSDDLAPTQSNARNGDLNGHRQRTPVADTARLMRFSDLLREFGDDAEAAHTARVTGQARGPVSGISALDRELSGAWLPGLHWIHGSPGTGKTAFALQVAAMTGTAALFVTCEMAPVELLRRHAARETGTFLGRFKSGELARAEAEALARRAITATPKLCLADATQNAAPLQFLSDAAQIARGNERHILIVLDSLHSWSGRLAGGLSEYEALNMAIADLQTLSGSLKCPILIVSERNRENMKSGGQSAGAGTRKIEYSGETVIELNRAPDAMPDSSGEVPIKLSLSKNRHGAAGKSIELMFNGALQRFAENNEKTFQRSGY